MLSEAKEAKQNACRLASRLLWKELDEPFVKALVDSGQSDVIDAFSQGARDVLCSFDKQCAERLAEEYCALFVLPEGISPRAAGWMPGEMLSAGAKISHDCQTFMKRYGQRPNPEGFGVLPDDHIALLLDVAAQSVGTSDEQEAFDRLVSPWSGAFAEALLARVTSPIYGAVGGILVLVGEL